MLHVAAMLLALTLQQQDSTQQDSARAERRKPIPAPTAAQLADAYGDAVARELVQDARERRRTVDQSIDAYSAVARERMWAGLRTLGRDRTLYARETATAIDWRRAGPVALQVLAAREVIPPVTGVPQIPSGIKEFVPHVAFDPVDSEILLLLNETSLRHPLAENAESQYRYRSGDTLQIRLPDGRTVRMIELVVQPRRATYELIQGSFWLEEETDAVVQAVFRLARGWDMTVDAEDGDDDDMPGILKPIRFDLEYVTLEYAFWDFRWWLPRTIAAEGIFQATRLFRMPFSYTLTYSDYEVEGDPARPRLAVDPDSLKYFSCDIPSEMSVQVKVGGDDSPPDPEEVERRRAARDAARITADSVAAASGDTVPRAQAVDEETGLGRDECGREIQVTIATDSSELMTSDYLPPSVYDIGGDWSSEIERVRELADMLGDLEEVPWQRPEPTFAWGLGAPGLVRYNRVEGASIGGRADLDLGRLRFDATARLAVAQPRPDLEIGVTRPTTARDYRLAVYNTLMVADPATRAFGIGNSFNALVLGRDDGEYYESLGASLSMAPSLLHRQWYDVRLSAERHDHVDTHTHFSLPGVFDGDREFRPNIIANEADLFGGELRLSGSFGQNPEALRAGATLQLDGAGGDFEFGRAALTLGTGIPLFAGLSASLEGAAGTSTGTVPVQRLYYLGGPHTLRGYGGNAARGDAFWRGRAELARGMPVARIALFADAAWAGPRGDWRTSVPLRSVGLGATLLDGLVRADLARALDGEESWRMDLWVSLKGM